MRANSGMGAVSVMTNHDDEVVQIMTERVERRLAEECGKLRAEMQQGFGDIRVEMHQGFGAIRVEMADRNAALLKWLLVYGATQTAALAGVIALVR